MKGKVKQLLNLISKLDYSDPYENIYDILKCLRKDNIDDNHIHLYVINLYESLKSDSHQSDEIDSFLLWIEMNFHN